MRIVALRIEVLAVGQGMCNLVVDEDGDGNINYLAIVDCGSSGFVGKQISNASKEIVILKVSALMRRRGDKLKKYKHIDALVISHFDEDHYNLIYDLLNYIPEQEYTMAKLPEKTVYLQQFQNEPLLRRGLRESKLDDSGAKFTFRLFTHVETSNDLLCSVKYSEKMIIDDDEYTFESEIKIDESGGTEGNLRLFCKNSAMFFVFSNSKIVQLCYSINFDPEYIMYRYFEYEYEFLCYEKTMSTAIARKNIPFAQSTNNLLKNCKDAINLASGELYNYTKDNEKKREMYKMLERIQVSFINCLDEHSLLYFGIFNVTFDTIKKKVMDSQTIYEFTISSLVLGGNIKYNEYTKTFQHIQKHDDQIIDKIDFLKLYSIDIYSLLSKTNLKLGNCSNVISCNCFSKNIQNDNSALVLIYRDNDHIALFTGDSTEHTMKNVTDDEEIIKMTKNCIIMTAPHHGAISSTNKIMLENFFNKLEPKKVVISAGFLNAFGHPAFSFVDTCKKYYMNHKTLISNDNHCFFYNTTDNGVSLEATDFNVLYTNMPLYATAGYCDVKGQETAIYYDYIFHYEGNLLEKREAFDRNIDPMAQYEGDFDITGLILPSISTQPSDIPPTPAPLPSFIIE
jgi:beta-lactamase superfamily II metal-dependent hydrolase